MWLLPFERMLLHLAPLCVSLWCSTRDHALIPYSHQDQLLVLDKARVPLEREHASLSKILIFVLLTTTSLDVIYCNSASAYKTITPMKMKTFPLVWGWYISTQYPDVKHTQPEWLSWTAREVIESPSSLSFGYEGYYYSKRGVHIIFKCLYPITAHAWPQITYLQALPYKHFMFIWRSMSLDFIPSAFFAAVGKSGHRGAYIQRLEDWMECQAIL